MKTSKSAIAYFLILFLCMSNGFAQSGFDISRMALINPSNPSQGLLWGESSSKCTQVLGNPSSVSNYYSEIDEENITVYNYGSNKVEFLRDRMVSYELSNSSIRVGSVGGQTIAINNTLSVRTEDYLEDRGPGMPQAHMQRTIYSFLDFPVSQVGGQTRGKSFKSMAVISAKSGGTQLDCRLELLFNSNNQLYSISLLD